MLSYFMILASHCSSDKLRYFSLEKSQSGFKVLWTCGVISCNTVQSLLAAIKSWSPPSYKHDSKWRRRARNPLSLNPSASSCALMCVSEIRRSSWSSTLWLEKIFTARSQRKETCLSRPHQSSRLKGAVRGNPGAVCHRQIQDEGVEDSQEDEEEEEDVRVRFYSTFW